MSTSVQILIVAIAVLGASGNPLFQGISFQRGFEINFKPLPFKPLEFIKEKWSPIGVFGKKLALHKRSLDDMVPPKPPERVPRPAAPVFEYIEEIEHSGPLLIISKVDKFPPGLAPVVNSKPPPPPPEPPIENLNPPPVPPVSLPPPPPPLPVPQAIVITEPPPPPENLPTVPHISTNMVIIHSQKVIDGEKSPKPILHTDITRTETVKEHLDSVAPPPPQPAPVVEHIVEAAIAPSPVPVAPAPPPVEHVESPVPKPVEHVQQHEAVEVPIAPVEVSPVPPPVPPPVASVEPIPPEVPVLVPPPPAHIEEEKKEETVPKNEVFLKDSTLIRGSKMALQFGTVFLTLMAQFFDSARASIDLMTNPPPRLINP